MAGQGTTPAIGNKSIFGIAAEREPCAPEKDFEFFRANPPINLDLVGTELPDGSLDPSGFAPAMLAGETLGDSSEVTLRLRAGDMLPWFHHLFQGGMVKDNPETGVFTYTFSGPVAAASREDYGLTAFLGLPPVENVLRHTFKVGECEIDLATPEALLAKFTGSLLRRQAYSFSVSDVLNAGSYGDPGADGSTLGIKTRGPIKHDSGPLYVRTTSSPTTVALGGTVDITAATNVLVGTGTTLLSQSVGDVLEIAGEFIALATITDDLNATFRVNHVGGAVGATASLVTSAVLTYSAEITDAAPTFPNAEIPITVDALSGRGDWSTLTGALKLGGTVTVGAGTAVVVGVGTEFTKNRVGQVTSIDGESIAILSIGDDLNMVLAANHTAGATDAEIKVLGEVLGYFAENKDPVEILFQGTIADHSRAVTGDSFSFSTSPADLVPTYAIEDRFQMAHVRHFFQAEGSADEISFDGIASTLKFSWPVEVEKSTGSQYASNIDRIGDLSASLDPFDLTHRSRNKELVRWAEGHLKFSTRIEVLGRQLGSGVLQEGFIFSMPYGSIGGQTKPVSDASRITLGNTMMYTTSDQGVSPISIVVHTDRDFTPPVFIP